jgi:hypothetical protein
MKGKGSCEPRASGWHGHAPLRGHVVNALTPAPRGGLGPGPPSPWPFLFNLQSEICNLQSCGRSIRNSQFAIRNCVSRTSTIRLV